ncbi:MAG: zinc ribbon domain-containing protein [Ruminiclostridium sp.]|nr:zinc ribbon domain-containing protein [Ruminiclostridium sp.]
MKWKRKLVLLRVSSVLMLLAALPMLMWCLSLINSAALDYDYAGAGCFGLFLTDSNIDENLPVTYQVVPQINFCSKCGNSVIPGDRFCSKCGNRI